MLTRLFIPESEEEAKQDAQIYFKRLCKWDGHENVECIELFGHPVSKVKAHSQVDIFNSSEEELEGDGKCFTQSVHIILCFNFTALITFVFYSLRCSRCDRYHSICFGCKSHSQQVKTIKLNFLCRVYNVFMALDVINQRLCVFCHNPTGIKHVYLQCYEFPSLSLPSSRKICRLRMCLLTLLHLIDGT